MTVGISTVSASSRTTRSRCWRQLTRSPSTPRTCLTSSTNHGSRWWLTPAHTSPAPQLPWPMGAGLLAFSLENQRVLSNRGQIFLGSGVTGATGKMPWLHPLQGATPPVESWVNRSGMKKKTTFHHCDFSYLKQKNNTRAKVLPESGTWQLLFLWTGIYQQEEEELLLEITPPSFLPPLLSSQSHGTVMGLQLGRLHHEPWPQERTRTFCWYRVLTLSMWTLPSGRLPPLCHPTLIFLTPQSSLCLYPSPCFYLRTRMPVAGHLNTPETLIFFKETVECQSAAWEKTLFLFSSLTPSVSSFHLSIYPFSCFSSFPLPSVLFFYIPTCPPFLISFFHYSLPSILLLFFLSLLFPFPRSTPPCFPSTFLPPDPYSFLLSPYLFFPLFLLFCLFSSPLYSLFPSFHPSFFAAFLSSQFPSFQPFLIFFLITFRSSSLPYLHFSFLSPLPRSLSLLRFSLALFLIKSSSAASEQVFKTPNVKNAPPCGDCRQDQNPPTDALLAGSSFLSCHHLLPPCW